MPHLPERRARPHLAGSPQRNAVLSSGTYPCFLLCLFLVLLLGGIGRAQQVTVWTSLAEHSYAWLHEQADSYSEAFGVDVEIHDLPLGELRERMIAEAAEGSAADLLVGVPHDQVRELAIAGILANFDEFATSAYLEDLSLPARAAFTMQGGLVGLPLYIEGPALISNTDLVPEAPSSYPEMVELAEELTSAETFGFLFDIKNFYYSYAWIRTFGGYVFGRGPQGAVETTDVGLANEGAVRGARELQALRFEHSLIPEGADYELANALFRDGSLAMTIDGPWAIGGYLAAGVPFRVTPLPPLEDGTEWSGFMGAAGVLLNAHSAATIDAVNLAKWLVREDAQEALALTSGRVPASRSAAESPELDPAIAGFARALSNAEPLIDLPQMGAVWRPMGEALDEITSSPLVDPARELREAVEQIRRAH